jgi:hypothetical protein
VKSPANRDRIHHVRTERGVSTYQIRRGGGDDAEVVAAVVVYSGSESAALRAMCTTCGKTDCVHAIRILERANGGR